MKEELIEKTRYTPEELKEFKGIIDEKIAQAREDYRLLCDQIAGRDSNGTNDTARTTSDASDGTDSLSREEMNQLAGRQQKFIIGLENALLRIKNGNYGVCRVTGTLIPKERLRIVPHTTQCVDVKAQESVFA